VESAECALNKGAVQGNCDGNPKLVSGDLLPTIEPSHQTSAN